MNSEEITNIIQKLADNQSKLTNVTDMIKKELELFRKSNEAFTTIVKKNNEIMLQMEEVIKANNELVSDLKPIIKEFSIYASNREDADLYLRQNIETVGESLQSTINLFTETKDLIDGIYKFSETLTNERMNLLNNIKSEKYAIIHANKLDEWIIDTYIETIRSMSFLAITNDDIQTWVVEYIQNYQSENNYVKSPKFLDLSERVKISQKMGDDIINHFKLTPFFEVLYWSFLVIYQSYQDGHKFTEHPKFTYVMNLSKNLEGMLYD